MTLVAFAGYAGTGKDTAAEYLVERYGFCQVRFADVIKLMLGAMLGVSVKRFEDREWKEQPLDWLPVTPRQLLQTLGTEWGRQTVDPDIWVRATMRRIAGMDRVVISDCRFDNEAAAVKAAGGIVVRVVRPGCGPINGHESETALSDQIVDRTIDNDRGLTQLFRAVDWLASDLKIEPRWRST